MSRHSLCYKKPASEDQDGIGISKMVMFKYKRICTFEVILDLGPHWFLKGLGLNLKLERIFLPNGLFYTALGDLANFRLWADILMKVLKWQQKNTKFSGSVEE